MTNEQIYKYADKKLSKQETRILVKYMGIAIFGGFGTIFMIQPVQDGCYTAVALISFFLGVIGFIITFILFTRVLDRIWFKPRRNYIYNLVRQDERNRIATNNKLNEV
jgi:Na+/proline symporter